MSIESFGIIFLIIGIIGIIIYTNADTILVNLINNMPRRNEPFMSRLAKAAGLADGVFIIVYNNSQYSKRRAPKQQIDPYEVFASESREHIQEWVARAIKLLATNYPVGDACVETGSVKYRKKFEESMIVEANENYKKIRDKFIKDNPGFSEKTYDRAISDGARSAR